jgi:hypothetical protein
MTTAAEEGADAKLATPMKKLLGSFAFVALLMGACFGDETHSFTFDAPPDQAFNAAYTSVLKNWTLRHASAKSDTIWFTLYGGRDRVDYDYGIVVDPAEDGKSKVTVVLAPGRETPKPKDAEKFAADLEGQMQKSRSAPLEEIVRQHGNRAVDDAYEAITRGHPFEEVFAAAKRAAERDYELFSADEAAKSVIFKRQPPKAGNDPRPGPPLVCIVNIIDQRHDDYRLRIKFRRDDAGKVYLSGATEELARQYFATMRRELDNPPGAPVINPRN